MLTKRRSLPEVDVTIRHPLCWKTRAEIRKLYDVGESDLRIFEVEGLLHPVRDGRETIFPPSEETTLQVILKGRRLGFTLDEIYLLLQSIHRASDQSHRSA